MHQTVDDAGDVLAEVRAQADDHSVDAGLDLTLEERLAGVFPATVVPDQRHGTADAIVIGIHAELLELDEAVRGCGPRLTLLAAPREWLSVPPREQRTAFPEAVVALQREEPRAPAFGGHPRALRPDDIGWRVAQVAQGLPADRRVGIEQPFQRRHGRSLRSRPPEPDPALRGPRSARLEFDLIAHGRERRRRSCDTVVHRGLS